MPRQNTTNRNGHRLWTNGVCRFCGEANVSESWTCPQLKPRLAAREMKERAAKAASSLLAGAR